MVAEVPAEMIQFWVLFHGLVASVAPMVGNLCPVQFNLSSTAPPGIPNPPPNAVPRVREWQNGVLATSILALGTNVSQKRSKKAPKSWPKRALPLFGRPCKSCGFLTWDMNSGWVPFYTFSELFWDTILPPFRGFGQETRKVRNRLPLGQELNFGGAVGRLDGI